MSIPFIVSYSNLYILEFKVTYGEYLPTPQEDSNLDILEFKDD